MTQNFIFSKKIILWNSNIKTKEFPWQLNKTPYNVWLSEIMLQQTQVITVIEYYTKFIEKFPTIFQLAQTELNKVLYLWSGLGYYKRAINLHKTSKIIVDQYSGEFPQDLDTLVSFPGIGRSTAGAILSLALNKHYPILDGNIKRILIRYYFLEKNMLTPSIINKKLWSLIEKLTPYKNTSTFNQAIMNLGRLICTYKKPKCKICPLNNHCQSFLTKKITQYPSLIKHTQKKSKRMIWWLILLLKTDQTIWLKKRSQESIWQKLFCFPEFYDFDILNKWVLEHNLIHKTYHNMIAFKHQVGNIQLNIQPILINIDKIINFNENDGIWYNLYEPAIIGLPKPVSIILKRLKYHLF